mgnify:CR=1 FL=1
MERSDIERFALPDVPGVYTFTQGRGKSKKILYIGKATSLRDRVRSYFDVELMATRGPRIVDMVTKADAVQFETTPTVLEALVREAALIRLHTPPANAIGKDDKTFLYAVITKEPVPRVLVIRGGEIDFKKKTWIGSNGIRFTDSYGPFVSGAQLRTALRLIRKIFPFYDTERPITINEKAIGTLEAKTNKHLQAKVEFNRQIGQYPRYMDTKEYATSIRNVSLFLSGKVGALRVTLTKDMKAAAKKEDFEEAARIRKQLYAIDHVQDVSLIREDKDDDMSGPRIEAYDTAHISGTNAIGVMVVVEHGLPQKKGYRAFNIQGVGGKSTNDDIASLKEILSRRLGHTEWPLPKAFVVDGGKTHKKAAEEVLQEVGVGVPVVAVVKDDKHRPREVIGARRAGIADADAVLANSEAHRFSLMRHRAARSKRMRTA